MRISDWSSDVCSSDLVNYDVDFTDLDEDGDVAFTSNGGWIGFTDKYWLSALIPDQKAPVSAKFRKGADDLYQADFSLEPALLAPGKTVSQTSRLFVGAKETKLLERYQDEGVTLFDRAIDWGCSTGSKSPFSSCSTGSLKISAILAW